MSRPTPLKKAPIVEAIIDVRVKLHDGFRCESFEAARETMRADFPLLRKQQSVTKTFQVGPKAGHAEEGDGPRLSGYYFLTRDEKSICQFREDGFTFNKLRPYSNWEAIFPIAKSAWSAYKGIADPKAIVRIAVRYINKFDVSVPIRDFASIFTTPPAVDERLPQEFLDFFSRVVIADQPDRAAAVVQTIEPSPKPNHATIVLDIDAFSLREVTDENFDESFALLRDFKNDVFFNSLTPATLEMFK